MRAVRWLFVSLVLVTPGHVAAQAVAVDWRLARPFPFFEDDAVYRYHLETWRGLPHSRRSIAHLERALNDPARLRGFAAQFPDLQRRVAERWASRPELAMWYVARQGWASVTVGRTIWSEREQRHNRYPRSRFSNREWRRAYVAPEGHDVLLSLRAPGAGDCAWTGPAGQRVLVDGDARVARLVRPCRDEVRAYVPFDPDTPRTTAIEVSGPMGTGRAEIRVRDVLVVGMGDSFSSGEGNPERPIIAHPTASAYEGPRVDARGERELGADGGLLFDAGLGVPVRHDIDGSNSPAEWLDRLCHRSVYSQQLRAALHIALADDLQQTAVTFLHYACSGAQVGWGVLGRFRGVEGVDPARIPHEQAMASQLAKLAADLCARAPRPVTVALAAPTRLFWPGQVAPGGGAAAPTDPVTRYAVAGCDRPLRRVDLLLMSAGGNDIGFAQLVMNAVASGSFNLAPGVPIRGLLRDWGALIAVDEAERRLAELPNRIGALHAALRAVGWLRERPNGALPVVWTAYPPIERRGPPDGPGEHLCTDPTAGMTVSPVFRLDVGALRETSRFTESLLERMDTAIGGLQADPRIPLVRAFRERFQRQGYCVVRNGVPDRADRLVIPVLHRDDEQPTDRDTPFLWRGGVHPRNDFRPYAARGRWVRTFDDAYLIANTADRNWELADKLGRQEFNPQTGAPLYMASAVLRARLSAGGPMHPTAEGHAEMADDVHAAAREMLRAFGR